MKIKQIVTPISLVSLVTLVGFLLMSVNVSADDSVVDKIRVTIPVTCTMRGTGMSSHNATINNGQYDSAVGETTLKAFCNDTGGFAIYAVGYTEDTDGNNVLTNEILDSTYDIVTGTSTSGANSNWAMKLSTITSPAPTYPLAIQSDQEGSFGSFHTVPNDYTLVAKRTSGTDIGESAEGSTLKTTYQVYISSTQPAGAYSGQVKYVLVHPSTAPTPVSDNQIGVIFDGNGQTFSGGATTNRVVYETECVPDYYIATSPYATVTSSNFNSDGTQNGSYTNSEHVIQTITVPNADRLKVVMSYGVTADTMGIDIVEAEWDGDWDNWNDEWHKLEIYDAQNNISGSEIFMTDSDTVTIYGESWSSPEQEYDYGFYVEVYPIYDSEQPNTEALLSCSVVDTAKGAYATTTGWDVDTWSIEYNREVFNFSNENEVIVFLDENGGDLIGTTITVKRANSFNEAFGNAGKTKYNNYYKIQDLDNNLCQSVGVGKNATLIDVRDNNTYMVGKLKDGNCWMLENLRLDPTNSTTASNMNASNTNAPATAISNYLNGGNPDNVSGWSSVSVSDYFSSDELQPHLFNSYNDMLVQGYGPAAVGGQAKVGILYNYCAVTVGTYCYYHNDAPDIYESLIDAPYSVCPKNWRLPTGGPLGEFEKLISKYSDNSDATSINSVQYNLSISLSGNVSPFYGPSYQDDSWSAWSSTWGDDYNRIFSLEATLDDASSPNNEFRLDEGISARCIVEH